MTEDKKYIAFFDMDHTLTASETLLPWLIEIRGVFRTCTTAALAGIWHLFAGFPGDRRTRYKKLWLSLLLRDVSLAEAQAAGCRLFARLRWLEPQVTALQTHRDKGHDVVVATGAATLLAEILITEKFGAGITVIGTELEIKNGHLTGKLSSENCVRIAKAKAVSAYMAHHGPYAESWGYGNPPHDLPMLSLLDHPKLIS